MRTPRNQPGPTPALGSIQAGEIMPAREFCRRMGLGRKAWSALLHRHFPTIAVGKQKIVDGAAAVAYFRGLGEQQSGSRNEDAASCGSVVHVQQLNQTNNFFGDFRGRFSQTNSNAGDVNSAVAEEGAAIQTTGTGNKVQMQEPKGSRWGLFWQMVKLLLNWGGACKKSCVSLEG